MENALPLPRARSQVALLIYGFLSLAGSLGLVRFGFSLILPSMQYSLHLSHTKMGILSTAHFFGYLLSSAMTGYMLGRYWAGWVRVSALGLAGISLILTGIAAGYPVLVLLQFATGSLSATAVVSALSLVSARFQAQSRGLATGITVSGVGAGLFLSSWITLPALTRSGGDGWKYGFYALGIATIALALIGSFVAREQLLGGNGQDHSGSLPNTSRDVYRSRVVWYIALISFFFGLSYIGYGTFFVAHLVQEMGYSSQKVAQIWSIVGLTGIVSGFLWGTLSDVIGRKVAMICAFLLLALTLLLAAAEQSPTGVYLSAVFYGLTAWSTLAIIATIYADLIGPRGAAAALGLAMVIFGIGQMAGPALVGYVADQTNSYRDAFSLSAAVAVIGALLSAFLAETRHDA